MIFQKHRGRRNDGVWEWCWDWFRPLRGRAEGGFNELIGLVSNVVLDQNVKDVSWWKLHVNGAFSVKALSQWIEEHQVTGVVHVDTYKTLWNNIVPTKVNMFAWRASIGRIPVAACGGVWLSVTGSFDLVRKF
ncbi:hypothetical protein Tco_0079321 [Tanacetum coccineum]